MPEILNINNVEVPVEQLRDNWALVLMNRGILIKLRISRWAGNFKLTPDILGLKFMDDEMNDFIKKYIHLGSHKLLPVNINKELQGIELRARRILDDHSFSTLWGHFVPFKAFESWQKNNEEVKQDYINAAKQVGYQYNSIVNIVREDYKKLAKDVWHRLHPNDPIPLDSFMENFVNDIVSKIPPREELVASFEYESVFLIVPMPSLIEADIAKADDIKRENAIKELTNNLEMDVKRKVAEEYLRKKRTLIDGFLDKTVMELRRYVAELCDNVLKSMQQSDKIEGDVGLKYRTKLTRMINKVKLLNFYDDEEIAKLISELELEINKFKGDRSASVVVEKLQEIVKAGRKEFLPNFNPAMGYLKVESL